MNMIRNIIFDLGEVIINVEPDRSVMAFEKLGAKDIIDIYNENKVHPVFGQFETGDVGAARFRDTIRKLIHLDIDDELFDQAWNAMLLDIPLKRIKLLEHMRQNYRTFLLSNTNSIHMDSINKYVKRTYNLQGLDSFFDKEYYSFEVGMRKPDPAIFELILRENELVPEETLFLDDVEEHLESARGLKIQTMRVTKEIGIAELLKGF